VYTKFLSRILFKSHILYEVPIKFQFLRKRFRAETESGPPEGETGLPHLRPRPLVQTGVLCICMCLYSLSNTGKCKDNGNAYRIFTLLMLFLTLYMEYDMEKSYIILKTS
jgi:hypothetical protein